MYIFIRKLIMQDRVYNIAVYGIKVMWKITYLKKSKYRVINMVYRMLTIPTPKPSRNHPMYGVFPYNAKKPYNIVGFFLRNGIKAVKKRNNEKLFIADPFMGSAVTIIEALKISATEKFHKRIRVIGLDLLPYSTFLAETLLTPLSPSEIKKIKDLKCKIYFLIKDLYTIKDPCSSNDVVILEERYIGDNPNPLLRKWKLVAIRVRDKRRKEKWYVARGYKKDIHIGKTAKITEINPDILDTYSSFKIPYPSSNFLNWVLLENTRIRIYKNMQIKHLFTPRNALAIKIIREYIEKQSDVFRKVLLGALAATIHLAKITDYKRHSAQSWYIPMRDALSLNVAEKFSKKIDELLNALEIVQKIWERLDWDLSDKNFNAKDFSELEHDKYVLIKNKSAEEIIDIVGEKTINLIHTDPPYADQVPYLEYYMPYVGILGIMDRNTYLTLFHKEIILSDSSERPNKKRNTNLGLENYAERFDISFKAISEALKIDGILQLWYAVKEREEWNALLKSIERHGFVLEDAYTIQRPFRTFMEATLKARDFMALIRGSEMIMEYRRSTKLKSRAILDNLTAEKLFISTVEEKISKGNAILGFILVEFVRKCLIEYYQPPPKIDLRSILKKYKYTIKKVKHQGKDLEVVTPISRTMESITKFINIEDR